MFTSDRRTFAMLTPTIGCNKVRCQTAAPVQRGLQVYLLYNIYTHAHTHINLLNKHYSISMKKNVPILIVSLVWDMIRVLCNYVWTYLLFYVCICVWMLYVCVYVTHYHLYIIVIYIFFLSFLLKSMNWWPIY